MKRYIVLAAALAAVAAFFLPPSPADATDKYVTAVLVADGGTSVTGTALDCGNQYSLQVQGAPVHYRTCATASCTATSSDAILDSAPRIYDVLLSGRDITGTVCDKYVSVRQTTPDAGTLYIYRAVPRTLPSYP